MPWGWRSSECLKDGRFSGFSRDGDCRCVLRGWGCSQDATSARAVVYVCCAPETLRELMLQAGREGLTRGDFAFFYIDVFGASLQGSHFPEPQRPWKRGDRHDANARQAFEVSPGHPSRMCGHRHLPRICVCGRPPVVFVSACHMYMHGHGHPPHMLGMEMGTHHTHVHVHGHSPIWSHPIVGSRQGPSSQGGLVGPAATHSPPPQAVTIITYKEPENPEYRPFLARLKEEALTHFNFSMKDGLVGHRA